MGWNFRRSINLGPFRINLSKSGIGYSVGAGGFRTGKTARGRKYRSFSLPGTGVSYRTSGQGSGGGGDAGDGDGKKGCFGFGLLLLTVGGATFWGVTAALRAWLA